MADYKIFTDWLEGLLKELTEESISQYAKAKKDGTLKTQKFQASKNILCAKILL